MGTVPTPPTFTAGSNATSTIMQALSDSAAYILGSTTSGGSKKPLFRGRQTVSQNLINATWTDITFDAEASPGADYDNGHSTVTNTARYTAQTAGWHSCSGGAAIAGSATLSSRGARFAVNGTAVDGTTALQTLGINATTVTCPQTSLIYLNVGDYLTLQGFQNSTVTVATIVSGTDSESSLSVSWVSN